MMNKANILVSVDHKGNRDLLEEYLKQYYEVKIVTSEKDLQASFDVGIFDGISLSQLRKPLQKRKESVAPLFQPVLLMTSRQDIGIVTGQLWQIVDEIIFLPIEKLELKARVEVLLRARKYSVELARLYGKAEETATREERQRLSRELHDSVSQTMFLASTLAQSIPLTQKKDPALASQQLEEVAELNRSALAQMRVLLMEMRPANLTRSNMKDLVEQLALAAQGQHKMQVQVDVNLPSPLPEAIQFNYYRIVQEALNNIVKHSGASKTEISFVVKGDRLELRVKDNGRGFDTNASIGRLGLQGIRERAALIGASMQLQSDKQGGGTELTVSQPIPAGYVTRSA